MWMTWGKSHTRNERTGWGEIEKFDKVEGFKLKVIFDSERMAEAKFCNENLKQIMDFFIWIIQG